MIKIFFLGTGAGSPTPSRWAPSIALVYNDLIGLLDCGEGCQLRLQQRGLSPLKIRFVAVTHLHGDHVAGLLPLIQSMTLFERRDPLEVIGPLEVRDLVEVFLRVSGHKTSFEIRYRDPRGPVSIGDRVVLRGFEVCHSPKSYGYVVELIDKRVVRKICYTGDTAPCDSVVEACRDADILIHDSTFTTEHVEEAIASRHSTAEDAARTALRAGVKTLYLTHISSRYNDPEKILREARRLFKNSFIANDLDLLILR